MFTWMRQIKAVTMPNATAQQFEALFYKLPSKMKSVLLLKYGLGHTYRDISTILFDGRAKSRKLCDQALSVLRKNYEQFERELQKSLSNLHLPKRVVAELQQGGFTHMIVCFDFTDNGKTYDAKLLDSEMICEGLRL